MAKNLVVTIQGYAGEIKESKGGQYVVVPVPVSRKNDAGEWETVEKHYFNVALDGLNLVKDNLYKITGELKISKWKNDAGETQVSFWVSKATAEQLAKSGKPGEPSAADLLTGFGATPF
jgi:hypothetical protein